MNSGKTTRKRSERGNVLIEFTLMSSVILMMTLGVADFGRIFTYGSKAYNAAAAGTSYGALSPAHYTDLDGMENAARNDLGAIPGAEVDAVRTCRCSIGGAPVSCPGEENCASGTPQTYIEVNVRIPFRSLSGLPWLPGVTDVRGKSAVRVE